MIGRFLEFNPCHDPESGRFHFRGQGDCEPGSSHDLADAIRKSADTPEEREFADDIAKAEIENRQLLRKWGPEGTKSVYFDRQKGAYTPERQKLHDEIVQKVLAGKDRQPLQSQQHPVAIFMAGMSASGKTLAARGLDYSNKLLINTDDIKTMLPEYNGRNASVLHDEAQDIADRILEIGRINKYGLVLDSTMKALGGVDYETARYGTAVSSRIKQLKQSGYRVEMRFTDVDVRTSLQRALKRYMKHGGHGQGKSGGRYVPVGYIKSNYDPKYGTRPRRTFEKIKHMLDAYIIVDNRGKTPVELGRKGKLSEAGPPPSEPWLSALDLVYLRGDEPASLREAEAAVVYAENFVRRFQRRGSFGRVA